MKNRGVLLDVIGDTDDELIPELTEKKPAHVWRRVAAGVCAAALIAGMIILPAVLRSRSPASDTADPVTATEFPMRKGSAKALAQAVYPICASYPDESRLSDQDGFQESFEAWNAERLEKIRQAEDCRGDIAAFTGKTASVFLNGGGTENRVYSPLSLYLALGMTAEVTGGATRRQIMDALGQEEIGALRDSARALWQANYADDGMAKCVLAASMWLSDGFSYRQDATDALAGNYYASSFTGDPADESYSLSLQNWLDEQTDGLLTDEASGIRMDPRTVLTLATTVNYSGKWHSRFSADDTASAAFRAPSGDVQTDFMNAERLMYYYWGDSFGSVSLPLENNGEMRLILPDEGVSPEELLSDPQVMQYLTHFGSDGYADKKYVSVSLSVPKFDVASSIDLQDGLTQLGVTDVFDRAAADFGPLSDSPDGIALTRAEQDTRVMIDEEGCRAAAMTVMMAAGSAQPDEHIDFVLDRPFLFEIVSESGCPLFIGVVNNPAG